jgi:ATP-dependent protease HslVU (ClpYQ) peptidase subunit
MTVCLAAIAAWGSPYERVVLASDRMITSGDVQFEHSTKKVETLNRSIVALIAGDVALHSPVGTRTSARLQPRSTVEEAAHAYRDEYVALRTEKVAQAVLGPFGLTLAEFHAGQQRFAPDFLHGVNAALQNITAQYDNLFEAIIAGVDGSPEKVRAHIYVIRGSNISCEDRLGFAAIGSGANQANLQFMLGHYGPISPVNETLLAMLNAKRAAEVAPGVGQHTDWFLVGPGLDTADLLRVDVEEAAKSAYGVLRDRRSAALDEAQQHLREKLAEIFKGPDPVPPSIPPVAPDEKAD